MAGFQELANRITLARPPAAVAERRRCHADPGGDLVSGGPSCRTCRPGKEGGAAVRVSGVLVRRLLVTLTLVGAHLLLPSASAAHDTQKSEGQQLGTQYPGEPEGK